MTTKQAPVLRTDAPASLVHEAPRRRSGRLGNALKKLTVPALCLLGGAALWVYLGGGWKQDHRDTLPPADETTAGGATQMMVTAEPVTFRPVERVVEAVGTLYGYEEIVISAKVEGRVLRIHHEVADRVAPDELLVEIDPTDYRLAVDQANSNLRVELAKLGLQEPPDASFDLSKVPTVMLAQARVDNTKSKLERNQRLLASNAASTGDVENAVSEFRTTQADHANQILLARSGLATIQLRLAALAIANQQLLDTQLRVPRPHREVPGMGGGVTYVITQRAVSEGSYVRAGGEICRLAIDKTLKLRVPVPERYTAQIKLGQRADVYTAAFDAPFPGVVTLINPAVTPATRTFDVEIQIANDRGELKSGSFAKATIQTGRTDEAATVPLSALVTFAGVTKIFLAEQGQAKEVLVTPGVQTRDWVEIAKPDLPRGAVVITSGQSGLAQETPVTIRNAVARTDLPSSESASPRFESQTVGSRRR